MTSPPPGGPPGAAPGGGPGGQAAGDAGVQALASRLFRAMLATQESFTAYLGVKLGLYEALAQGGPATARQLASRAGLAPRYVREWLEQQAAAGLVAVDDPALAGDLRVYRLPPGYERVLTPSADPMSLAWTAMLPIGGVAAALPQLLAAFRSGDGVDADAFGPDWRHGHGGANRALYTYQLTGRLRQHLPDVHERLSAGVGRIADVGCGAGWAAIALARAYRGAQLTAVDLDAESIAQARLNAAQAGVADRVSFHVADAATLTGGRDYDLVCVFDAAHELARPVEVLRACRQLLAPAGAVLLLESRISDTGRVPADDLERFQYATSVLHCLPAGLVGEGAVGTGTVLRPAVVRSYARDAGFGSVQAYDFGDGFHQFYRLDG